MFRLQIGPVGKRNVVRHRGSASEVQERVQRRNECHLIEDNVQVRSWRAFLIICRAADDSALAAARDAG